MACAVFLVQVQPAVAGIWPAFELLLEVGIGAVTYLGSLLLLWRLCGLEPGPERTVVNFAKANFGRLHLAR